MAKKILAGTHTTLTETAALVVSILETLPGVKKVSPGIITQNRSRSGRRRISIVVTNAGLELIISGQATQKVAVHCSPLDTPFIIKNLTAHKRLMLFTFKVRERKPGI